MEKMQDLKDLLTHELEDLLSAENQIIEALPKMIEKAKNQPLKNALQQHLQVTESQKQRLEEVIEMLKGSEEKDENPGVLSRLFGGGEKVCKGMQGLIKEGEKIMNADMNPQVIDAAIIACAQKIEHYEICGYGTVRAYANELNLGEISGMLEQTLNEEYEADDLLTSLAVGGLNQKAENGRASRNNKSNGTTRSKSTNGTSKKSPMKKSSTKKSSTTKSSAASKSKGSTKNRKARISGTTKRGRRALR